MTRRVVSSNSADDDLSGAADFYRQTADAETAERFIDAAELVIRRIAAFPSVGSTKVEALTGVPGLRSLAVEGFPYQLLYTSDDDVIRVHRVLHQRRDISGAVDD